MKKWSVFAATVLFVGYLLMAGGAPPVGVLCGIVLAGLLTLRKTQSA